MNAWAPAACRRHGRDRGTSRIGELGKDRARLFHVIRVNSDGTTEQQPQEQAAEEQLQMIGENNFLGVFGNWRSDGHGETVVDDKTSRSFSLFLESEYQAVGGEICRLFYQGPKAWMWVQSGLRPNGPWEIIPGFTLGKALRAWLLSCRPSGTKYIRSIVIAKQARPDGMQEPCRILSK